MLEMSSKENRWWYAVNDTVNGAKLQGPAANFENVKFFLSGYKMFEFIKIFENR